MAHAYKPRILVQGAFMVALDGSVHSTMYESLSSPRHFLLLNHWDLTAEGVTDALNYTQRHPMDQNGCQGLKVAVHSLLNDDSIAAAEKTKLIASYFGLSGNPHAMALADSYIMNTNATPEEKSAILKELVQLRIQSIRDDIGGFIDRTKAQRTVLHKSRWRMHCQHMFDKAVYLINSRPDGSPINVTTAAGGAIILAIIPTGIEAMISDGLDAGFFAIATGSATLGGAIMALGLRTTELAGFLRKHLGTTPEISEKKGKALIRSMEQDIERLPGKTRLLMRHYDPLVFVGHHEYYYSGLQKALERNPEEIRPLLDCNGLSSTFENGLYVQASQLGQSDAATLFEEIRHLIHQQILHYNRDDWQMVGTAFKADIVTEKGFTFFKNHAYKKNFWNEPRYKNDIGEEAFVECDHIPRSLIRSGKSEAKSLRMLEEHLPHTFRKYRMLPDGETTFLAHLHEQDRLAADMPAGEMSQPLFASQAKTKPPFSERINHPNQNDDQQLGGR